MVTKNKKRFTTKIVGYISQETAEKFDIEEHANKEIVQSSELDVHTNKHANDFFSIDSYHNTLMNIDNIINNPYHIEYDKKRRSMKYYGKVDQYVCVVVRLDKKEIYVSTIYPQSKKKIDKIKDN